MVINVFMPKDIYGGNKVVDFIVRKKRRKNNFKNKKGIKSFVIKDEVIDE